MDVEEPHESNLAEQCLEVQVSEFLKKNFAKVFTAVMVCMVLM